MLYISKNCAPELANERNICTVFRQILVQRGNRNYVLISVIVYKADWRGMERMIKARTKIMYTFFFS